MDTINNKIKVRYGSREICADISCLDPRNFENIKNDGLSEIVMKKISEKLNSINPNVTQALIKETIDFINKFNALKQNISFSYLNEDEDIDEDDFNLDEKEYPQIENSCNTCSNCIHCCYIILIRYSLYDSAYSSLYS